MTAPTDQTAPTDPTASTDRSAGPRLRASDAERAAAVARLHDAVGEGRLTLEECAERTEATYRARYLDELPPLTADLPEPVAVAPGWRALASAASLQARTSALGVPTWSAATPRRRLLVVLAAVVLLLLFAVAVAAAAGGDPPDGVPPFPHPHGWDWQRGS